MRDRPRIVTFLAAGVLIYTGFYGLRFYKTLTTRVFLEELPLIISPLYLQVTGLVFGLGGLVCFLGLWRGLPWAPRVTKTYIIITALFVWADRLLIAAPESNWPFVLGATLFIIGYLFLIFHSEAVRDFFLETK